MAVASEKSIEQGSAMGVGAIELNVCAGGPEALRNSRRASAVLRRFQSLRLLPVNKF